MGTTIGAAGPLRTDAIPAMVPTIDIPTVLIARMGGSTYSQSAGLTGFSLGPKRCFDSSRQLKW
jgi:hypothetical protein